MRLCQCIVHTVMIKPSKVPFRALRTFCVAARRTSFREAAEVLFITASAVSHQIKALEEDMGGQLFERSGRAIRLTSLGQSLYDDIAPLIRQVDAIVEKHQTGAVRPALQVSVQPFFASEYFVPRLREFTLSHPDIDLQVGTSDESSDKHPKDADFSIRLFERAPANLASARLFPLRHVPAGSPDFARQLNVKNKEIQGDFPILVHETRADAWKNWSQSTGISLPANAPTIRFDSMIAAARAAERGVGAALMPVPLGDRWFESGSLVRLFEQDLTTEMSYFLVWQQAATERPECRALREWILQTFARKS